jgi:hypothetical protein
MISQADSFSSGQNYWKKWCGIIPHLMFNFNLVFGRAWSIWLACLINQTCLLYPVSSGRLIYKTASPESFE